MKLSEQGCSSQPTVSSGYIPPSLQRVRLPSQSDCLVRSSTSSQNRSLTILECTDTASLGSGLDHGTKWYYLYTRDKGAPDPPPATIKREKTLVNYNVAYRGKEPYPQPKRERRASEVCHGLQPYIYYGKMNSSLIGRRCVHCVHIVQLCKRPIRSYVARTKIREG